MIKFIRAGLKNLKHNVAIRLSLKIILLYLIAGSLWILFTDNLIHSIFDDAKNIYIFSLLKGWIYIIITALIGFILIYKGVKRIQLIEKNTIRYIEELKMSNQKLEIAYEEISEAEEALKHQLDKIEEAQFELKESEERHRLAIEGANDCLWYAYIENGKQIVNFEKTKELLGYNYGEIGDSIEAWKNLIHPKDLSSAKAKMEACFLSPVKYYENEYRLKKKNGTYIWVLSKGRTKYDSEGRLIKMAGSHTNINEKKRYENRIRHLAFHDELTRLPNKAKLKVRIEELIKDSTEKNKMFSIILADINNFRMVNELFSPLFGDKMLKGAGELLKKVFCKVAEVYRIEGDTFALLIPRLKGIEKAKLLALSIKKIFENPWMFENQSIYTPVNIGISIYPLHGDNASVLISRANIALVQAKENKKDRYCLFEERFNDSFKSRMEIYSDLKSAIKNNELMVYYQPQMDSINGKILGFEALVRWQHPTKGLILPDKFIPLAEETGLIIGLTDFVLDEAVRQINEWNITGKGTFSIAVNFSPQYFQIIDSVGRIKSVLKRYDFNPQYLEIEITESSAIKYMDVVLDALTKFRSYGIKVALDDFGTGYSSLNYFASLPIDIIKIDKSFIDDITSDYQKQVIANSLIEMASKFMLTVVAEGVETLEQKSYLDNIKCQRQQGYLFSKPLPAYIIEKSRF